MTPYFKKPGGLNPLISSKKTPVVFTFFVEPNVTPGKFKMN